MTSLDLSVAHRMVTVLDEAAADMSPKASQYVRNSEIPRLANVPASIEPEDIPANYAQELAGDLCGAMFIAGHSLRPSLAAEWVTEPDAVSSDADFRRMIATLTAMENDGVVGAVRLNVEQSELEELAMSLRTAVLRLSERASEEP